MDESLLIEALAGRLLSGVLLFLYLGWGVYTLRLRFRFHEELRPAVEAVTLALVALFYSLEMYLLKAYLGPMHVYLVFAVLGLFVSGAALYGPMFISLSSRLLVDMVMPAERSQTHEPQYQFAEALERDSDYEGAIQEYKVIARVFPRDADALMRVAENYAKLSQIEEAAGWFERALKQLDSAEKSLAVTNRLCEMYHRTLDRAQDAERVLEAYLDKFPEAEYASSVRQRLERLKAEG